MTTTRTHTLGIGVAVAALAMVAGCGSSSSGGNGNATVANAGASTGASTGTGAGGLNTMSTSIGTVLVNSAGHTVYELAGDTAGNQTCTSSCQAFWPPVTSGGKDLVINGHPAFTFTEDSGAGQTHGQGVQDTWGTWFALDASGNPIGATATKPAPKTSTPATTPASSSKSGGSGGYGY